MIAVFAGSPLFLFSYSSFLLCLPPLFVLLSSLFLITSSFLFFTDSPFLFCFLSFLPSSILFFLFFSDSSFFLSLFPMRTAFLLLFSYSPFLLSLVSSCFLLFLLPYSSFLTRFSPFLGVAIGVVAISLNLHRHKLASKPSLFSHWLAYPSQDPQYGNQA